MRLNRYALAGNKSVAQLFSAINPILSLLRWDGPRLVECEGIEK